MLFAEILIDAVFVAALLTATSCFVYLVYMTILERHLLGTHRVPARATGLRNVAQTISSSVTSKSESWRAGPGSPALPSGKR